MFFFDVRSLRGFRFSVEDFFSNPLVRSSKGDFRRFVTCRNDVVTQMFVTSGSDSMFCRARPSWSFLTIYSDRRRMKRRETKSRQSKANVFNRPNPFVNPHWRNVRFIRVPIRFFYKHESQFKHFPPGWSCNRVFWRLVSMRILPSEAFPTADCPDNSIQIELLIKTFAHVGIAS